MADRNWQCRACGERGDEATESAPFLRYEVQCLADQEWFAARYPPGMKHHWADGTPLSINDGNFWWAVGTRVVDEALRG